MALKIPAAVERSHMIHPDFRIAGKIFASLGVPNKNWGMVKLTPEQQRRFIEKAPKVFEPCSGAWGTTGLHECFSRHREGDHCARCSRRCGKEYRFTQVNRSMSRSEWSATAKYNSRNVSGEHRLPARRSRQLAETGK